MVADQVVDDRARLVHHLPVVGDYGRLAQRMNGLEFGRRQPRGGVALVVLDLVRKAEFFKQPHHTLRARIVEVVDDDHAISLGLDGSLLFYPKYALCQRRRISAPGVCAGLWCGGQSVRRCCAHMPAMARCNAAHGRNMRIKA